MKRLLGQALVVTAVGMLTAAATPGCADNDQAIFVQSVFAPPTNRQNGSCLYSADPTQPMISYGKLDVGLSPSKTYQAMLLVGSQLIQRGETNAARAESNRVHINGAVVRVTDANGGAISEYTTLGSGFVDPQLNNIADYGVVSLPLIDAATAIKVAPARGQPDKLIVANLKLFGKTLGGVDIESGEFQFPVYVCTGCLVSFPSSADDPATNGFDCNAPLAASAAVTAPCHLGQDEGISCQQCQGNPICTP